MKSGGDAGNRPARPVQGIFEADAAPGQRAWVVYIGARRVLRVECAEEHESEVLTFLWRFLCAHERHLRLME